MIYNTFNYLFVMVTIDVLPDLFSRLKYILQKQNDISLRHISNPILSHLNTFP